jgi:flagellin
MGLRINQNIAAMNAYRNLSVTDGQMSKSLEKLSSGYRINRAADDAAGLAISEGLRSQVGGLKVAVRNAQDGVSVVQTAEGALTETHSILQRMRDLSVQAANSGGLNADAKQNIQSEITQLKAELTRIADTTQFNGTKLLDGNYNGTFQVGANVGETISVSIGSAMSAAGLGVDTLNVTTDGTATTATSASTGADAVLDYATSGTAEFTVTVDGGTAQTVTLDQDYTDAAAKLTAINDQLSGVTASYGSAGELVLTADAVGDTAIAVADVTGTEFGTATVVAGTASGADLAIGALDDAISSVSTLRADLGAVQNRFDHTINNLNVAVENLSASESRIRDTDMAAEMMNFTRAQILSQAGTAMLAQANQVPQGVLQLLR